ncbi:MAG: hypothetical protein PHI32_11070 [Dysgonamonadaceae bacterium]|nr:hypothetical protein [Dysgonamonadaceae bacterium]
MKYIKEFIDMVKKKYPNIIIEYNYELVEDMHWIYHNSYGLEFESSTFHTYIGGLMKKLFFANDIFNVSFCYNYQLAKKTIYYAVLQNSYIANISGLENLGNRYENVLLKYSSNDYYYLLPQNPDYEYKIKVA